MPFELIEEVFRVKSSWQMVEEYGMEETYKSYRKTATKTDNSPTY